MARGDVTMMGAGVFGLACAWALARRGARVCVIDPNEPGAGASGGVMCALAPFAPEAWNALKAFQLRALIMAEGWWREVAREGGGDPGYLRHGRLQPLADARAVELAREREVAAAGLWPGEVAWRVVPATGAAWEPPSATGLLIRDTLSARLSPRGALAALVAAIRARGGEIHREAVGGDSGIVVHATGARGLHDLSRAFGCLLGTGQKGQAALLRHDAGDAPQIFAEGIHAVPEPGGLVAVGSVSERWWEGEAPDERVDALIRRARQLVPALGAAPVVERWAAIRPRAVSRAPVLGPWPGRDGHFVANGGFQIGFAVVPLVAELLAALVVDGQDAIPAEFRVEALVARARRQGRRPGQAIPAGQRGAKEL